MVFLRELAQMKLPSLNFFAPETMLKLRQQWLHTNSVSCSPGCKSNRLIWSPTCVIYACHNIHTHMTILIREQCPGMGILWIFPHLQIFSWQPIQDFEWAHINYKWLHAVLTSVGWGWSEICRVTAQVAGFFFFFKICPHSEIWAQFVHLFLLWSGNDL